MGPAPRWIGGAGVAVLAAGAGFGVLAQGSYDDAEALCPDHRGCGGAALEASEDADLYANVSNAGVALGLVGVGVALVLLLSGDASERAGGSEARVTLAPGTGRVGVGVRF